MCRDSAANRPMLAKSSEEVEEWRKCGFRWVLSTL